MTWRGAWNRWFVACALLLPSLPGAPLRAQGLAGLQPDAKQFPLAVWLQSVENAPRYQTLGINLYVGLWEGPTVAQLAALQQARMRVVCSQNAAGLDQRWKDVIVGWLQQDEPDNAQELPDKKGYGPPVPAKDVLVRYQAMSAADPLHRPVLLNLGQGVAWDGWYGRGVRTNHPEDYPEYVQAGDLVSFDIYPVTHDRPEVAGKLELVGQGVKRLVGWTEGKKPVWACIETTHISNPKTKPTGAEVRAEVWMAIIHGARGIIYFSHEFAPKFVEAGLLSDMQMARSVRQVNAEITRWSPFLLQGQEVQGAAVEGSVAMLVRRQGEATVVFAVGMSSQKVHASFKVAGLQGTLITDDDRRIDAANGTWSDDFDGYAVHIYRFGDVAK